MNLMRSDLEDYEGASNLAFNDKVKDLQTNGRKIYHFGFGQSPFPVPKVFVDNLKNYATRHEYLPVAGIPDLRQQIIDFHRRYDDLHHFDKDSLILGAGSKELLFLIANVFGGDILLVSPSWTTYYPQCKLAGRPVHIIPTYFEDKWLPTTDAIKEVLKSKCKAEEYKLLVLNNPNNPTGLAYPTKFLQELATVCRQNNILILSDEIYARLHYTGNHHSISKFYPEGTILTSGFSKWSSAGGWRAGYAIFPTELKRLYKGVASGGSHTFTCCPAPVQFALRDGLQHQEELEGYILHTRKILGSVGKFVHKTLSEAGAKGHEPEAGYYMMPDFLVCKKSLDAEGYHSGQDMCDFLLNNVNVALMPAGPYYLRPVDELTTRFCFVNFNGEKALKASYNMGLDKEIDQDFLRTYCSPTVEGTEVIANWIKQNSTV